MPQQICALQSMWKCVSGVSEIEFLGHTINGNSIPQPISRVETITNYKRFKTCKEFGSFLNRLNFFRRFISNSCFIYKSLLTTCSINNQVRITTKSIGILPRQAIFKNVAKIKKMSKDNKCHFVDLL